MFVLSVEANYIFDDLAEINNGNGELVFNAHQAKELRRLFDSYLNLPNRDMQKSLVRLTESVAQADKWVIQVKLVFYRDRCILLR